MRETFEGFWLVFALALIFWIFLDSGVFFERIGQFIGQFKMAFLVGIVGNGRNLEIVLKKMQSFEAT